MNHYIFLLVAILAAGCGRSKELSTTEAAGGQKIVKEFFPDGTIKSVTRLNPDGSLLGRLYYSNGVPDHADYFDSEKRVRRTLLYRADGTAKVTREFDEHGNLLSEQALDSNGAPTGKAP